MQATTSAPDVFFARVMQYLETPQYLRKALFPIHPDLKLAGLLNPLDAPHHLRAGTKREREYYSRDASSCCS
jgi:predicted SPOUT superfamily RNA methylase MTH1